VEKTSFLGGRLAAPNLKHLYPNMRPAEDVLEEKLRRLGKSSAQVLFNTEVEDIQGFVGSFEVTLKGDEDEPLEVGAIVLATGADLFRPDGQYRYGEFPNVITSEELENIFSQPYGFNSGRPLPKHAAFVLCVGSRDEEFSGCSRYCCPTAIKQALEFANRGVNTTVFFRDIRTISTGAEEMYREARGRGVLFVRIPPGKKVEVLGQKRVEAVRCFDDLLNRTLEVPADMVILSVGMRPRQPETAQFHHMLKCSLGLDGFFLERHPELAPVETAVEGVFIAGTVQGPKDIVDSVAQASAAAAKAAVFLAHDMVKLDPAIAEVIEVKCRACGTCVDICQFQAPKIEPDGEGGYVARINPSLCKGCGTCTSWCPSGAIISRHFTDQQVNAQIDAFFAEEVIR
jgi:heterodisulfide reductase subunit A